MTTDMEKGVVERLDADPGPHRTTEEGRLALVTVAGVPHKVHIHATDEGFWGKALGLLGCVSQGGSEEKLLSNLKDAIESVLETADVHTGAETRLTVEEFALESYLWHEQYLADNPQVPVLEEAIGKSRKRGYLDRTDLREVVTWGGNPYGMWGKIDKRNDDSRIARCTADAIAALNDPETALERITRIHGLGVSFGSKALAFLSPETCPVFDSVIDKGCLIWAENWTHRYGDLAALCRNIAALQRRPNPHRPGGDWLVRDIEMAMFQFAWRAAGEPGRYIVGALPLGGME